MLILLFLSIFGLFGLVLVAYIFFPLGITMAHYPLLLILGFFAGCGIATFSVGISQTSYWFPKEDQGKALGIYAGVGNLAPGIFSIIMAIILILWGLGGSYLLWFLILTIGTIIYYFIGLDACSFQLEKAGHISEEILAYCSTEYGQQLFFTHKLKESLSISVHNWKTWLLVSLYFTSFGGFIGLAAWFPTYWLSLHKIGNINFGNLILSFALLLTATFIILGSLIRVFSGPLADKTSGTFITILGTLILLIGAVVMITATASLFILAIIGMLIIAIGMGMVNAGVFKLVPKSVPDAVGGAAGWIGGLGAFGGFVIPPILGYFVDIMDLEGYSFGFIVFVILAVISLVITIILKKKIEE
jgi:NNP family nitrate/nitrite transporter-like MFS transporter